MKIIGITGTNGKTSTAQFIYQMLSGMGHKTAVSGTLGITYCGKTYDVGLTTPAHETLIYHIGEMINAGIEYLVMEVSSHSLVQDRVKGLEFEVGVFTNLTQDHLDYHGDLDNYKEAKRKLLNQSKTMVFNVDDTVGEEFYCDFASRGNRCVNIATKSIFADISAKSIKESLSGTDFVLDFFGTRAHICIPALGCFSVYNYLSAIGTLYLLGFDFDEIVAASDCVRAVKGRTQLLDLDRDFSVMIDFAHSPDALRNVLSMVKKVHDGRLITLFGCGGERDRTKRPLMAKAAAEYSDYVYLTSDNPRGEDPLQIITDALPALCESGKPYRVITDREEAIIYAVKSLMPGDLLVLAGKGHERYQIVGNTKLDFSEEEIVRKALIF